MIYIRCSLTLILDVFELSGNECIFGETAVVDLTIAGEETSFKESGEDNEGGSSSFRSRCVRGYNLMNLKLSAAT